MPERFPHLDLDRRELLKLLGVTGLIALTGCAAPAEEDAPTSTANQVGSQPDTEEPSDPTENIPPTEAENAPTSNNEETPTEASIEEQLALLMIPLAVAPLPGNGWMEMPVAPETLNERTRQLFRLGQEMGRDPRRFSVIGDCQSIPVYFLTGFDGTPGKDYFLGDTYANLQETIDYYKGSYGGGVAANGGQNVAAVFSPLWADPAKCESNEGPLACELRLSRSCLALISLEENWNGDLEGYRANLIEIVKYCISQGVIPVLTTKASNLEGDHSINRTIAEVTREYGIPLWNYWLSLQGLPSKGLIKDGFHLTQGWSGRFDYRKPELVKSGWAVRNLTALQVLDFLRRELSQELSFSQRLAVLFSIRS
jgi:hypothetical protein